MRLQRAVKASYNLKSESGPAFQKSVLEQIEKVGTGRSSRLLLCSEGLTNQ